MPSGHYFPRKLHLQLGDGEDRLRTVHLHIEAAIQHESRRAAERLRASSA